MAKADLTAQRLRELLIYDEESGIFTRKLARNGGNARAGMVAGTVEKDLGYVRIVIGGMPYRAHRLAWLYVYGEWPSKFIDHINGVRSDNRIVNLRNVSNLVNMQNMKGPRKDNKSGRLGVIWSEQYQQWQATIKSDGRQVVLGHDDDLDKAAELYLAAKRRLHEGCTI